LVRPAPRPESLELVEGRAKMDASIAWSSLTAERLAETKFGTSSIERSGCGRVKFESPLKEIQGLVAFGQHRATTFRGRSTPCAVGRLHLRIELVERARCVGTATKLQKRLDVLGVTWSDERLPHVLAAA
jgi:hypothetical protein